MTLWGVLAFFLVFSQVAGQEQQYALLGEKTIMKTGIKSPPDEILWKSGGNKVVEFNGKEEKSFLKYEGRVGLDYHSADLTISNLQFEDSGVYELETYTNNKMSKKYYKLEVIDKVAKPTISCTMSNADTSDKSRGQGNLTCSTSSSLVKFKWSSNANVHLGPQLVITLGDEHDDLMYNCTVRNPLTQESATFIAKECYPDTSIPGGLIAGVIVGILLLIIILVLCILYKKGCLRHEKNYDVESQDFSFETKKNFSESEESQVLLDRAPTLPSKQTLGHLAQRNDVAQSDPPHKEESGISIKKYHRNCGSEKNKIQDCESSSICPAPDKPPRTFSNHHAKENGKATETEPQDVAEDAERNAEQTHVSSENNDEVKPKVDELGKDSGEPKGNSADSENGEDTLSGLNTTAEDTMVSSPPPGSPENLDQKQPADSKETNDALPGLSDDNGPEENEDEDNKAPHPPKVPKKSEAVQNYPDLIKAIGERTPPNVKRPVGDNPAESGNPNEEADDHSLNTTTEDTMVSSPPPASPENLDQKEPADSKETNYALPGLSNDDSPEENEDEDKKARHPPEVPKKTEVVRKFSLIKSSGERMPPKVKGPVVDNPAESGNPNEEADDHNSENKEEEKESAKPTSENDVQPPSVAMEFFPLSQNSPKISPKDEHKQDTSSDERVQEFAKESTGNPSAVSTDELENESPDASPDTSKETDSESSENKQQTSLH